MSAPPAVARLATRRSLGLGAALLVAEAATVVGYVALAAGDVLATRYLAYPLVWVNVALFGLAVVPGVRRTLQRPLGAGVAGGYALVLLWLDDSIGFAHHATDPSLTVVPLPPGWGPALQYGGPVLSVSLFPFTAFGYAALGALVAVAVVDATDRALGGVVGLFSCVGCTGPVVATAFTGASGGAAAATAIAPVSYDLSTVVFAVAILAMVAALTPSGG